MPYHVRVTPRSDPNHPEVRLDLTREQLEERFLSPYREGRPIVIGGKTIAPEDIERIQISFTDHSSDELLPVVRAELQASPVIRWLSEEWYVADRAKDVTDELIIGPPGTGLTSRPQAVGPPVEGARVVFVVHGRNSQLRDATFTFLRALSLHPLEFAEAVIATGKTAPYVGEILEKAFSIAQAVLVLMTPDDEARLLEPFQSAGEPPHETTLTPQARANVIFEAGMAMGKNPDRTVLVEVGNLRPFSDIGGRHTVRMDNSTQRRQDLAHRLLAAGCPANLVGTDWHTAGDFSLTIPAADSAAARADVRPKSSPYFGQEVSVGAYSLAYTGFAIEGLPTENADLLDEALDLVEGWFKSLEPACVPRRADSRVGFWEVDGPGPLGPVWQGWFYPGPVLSSRKAFELVSRGPQGAAIKLSELAAWWLDLLTSGPEVINTLGKNRVRAGLTINTLPSSGQPQIVDLDFTGLPPAQRRVNLDHVSPWSFLIDPFDTGTSAVSALRQGIHRLLRHFGYRPSEETLRALGPG
jgi:predicted nucleotide-binding protein